MKHFSITEWADFARDVATEEQSTEMQKHLDEGCSICRETVQTWKSVTECARHELDYDPPSSALRIAKSYFAPFKLASKQATSFRIARLTFDSFARRAEVGVRGSDQSPRQLMYQFDNVFIDLRIEPNPASKHLALAGQVADSGSRPQEVEGMAVSLLQDGAVLSKTSTNQFGEFRLSFKDSKSVQLLVDLKETPILVWLPGIDSGAVHL